MKLVAYERPTEQNQMAFFYIPRTITVESFKFIYMYFYYSLLNKINFFDQRLQVFFVS